MGCDKSFITIKLIWHNYLELDWLDAKSCPVGMPIFFFAKTWSKILEYHLIICKKYNDQNYITT